jgi:hypothetical protein
MTLKQRSNSPCAKPLFGAVAATLVGAAIVSAAVPEAATRPSGQSKGMITAIYHVADLVAHEASWRRAVGDPARQDVSPIESLVRVLLTSLDDPEHWGNSDGAYVLHVNDSTKLEVRAPAEEQRKIVDVLTALRILADVAVVMENCLLEIDQDTYDKEVRPALGSERFALAIDDARFEQLRKQGTLVRKSSVLIEDSCEMEFFSQRRAFSYIEKPRNAKARDRIGTRLAGFAFKARPTVSPDRRRVRLELTQETSELAAMAGASKTGGEMRIGLANLSKRSTTATVNVEEEQPLLLLVQVRPRAAKAKDRVLLLIVRPTIRIKEEERQRHSRHEAPLRNPPSWALTQRLGCSLGGFDWLR